MHFLGSSPYTRRDRREVLARPSTWASRAYGAARSLVQRDAASTRRLVAILAEARARLELAPRQGFPWDGRRVACTTTPRLDPTAGMPAHWHYVGPVTWSAPGPELDLSGVEDSRPLVYVTQGSTGAASRLRRAVRELANDDVQLLVATAQLCDPAELARTPGVMARRYLPDAECSRRADVAVVHGGHLSASQAHVAGTPVVVLPTTNDQRVWAARVERLGTGIAVRPPVVPGAIRRGVRRELGQPAHAEAARAVAEHLKAWPGAQLTAQLVEDLVP
jgi:UDP:flavonoid glycosyltransferase YjiC (YdhE family)